MLHPVSENNVLPDLLGIYIFYKILQRYSWSPAFTPDFPAPRPGGNVASDSSVFHF